MVLQGRRRLRAPWRSDRGSTTVEAASFWALKLLAVAVLVQLAVWGLADLSARQAAHHGLQAARVAGSNEQIGHEAAAGVLEAINPLGLTDVTIAVDRGPENTTVTITGTTLPVIPGVSIPVEVAAEAPTEPDPVGQPEEVNP